MRQLVIASVVVLGALSIPAVAQAPPSQIQGCRIAASQMHINLLPHALKLNCRR